MSNRNSNRRRRRGPRPQGFTGPGFGAIYRVMLPLKGPEKLDFFNRVSRWAVAGVGLAGSVMGYSAGGVLGAALGLGVGLAGAAKYMVKHRFHRP